MKEFVQYFSAPKVKDRSKESEEKKAVRQNKKRPKNVGKYKLIIKESGKFTKFKLRTASRLITYKTDKADLISQVKDYLPPNLTQVVINKKREQKKKNKK